MKCICTIIITFCVSSYSALHYINNTFALYYCNLL